MNISSSQFKDFLIKYKWIIIPGIPLIFFSLSLMFIFLPVNTDIKNQPLPQNPSTQPSVAPRGNIEINESLVKEKDEFSLERRPGLEKTEIIDGGSIKYSFASNNAARPNIIISNYRDVVFQRSVTLPSNPVKITDYIESYGQVKWIFKGSKFYGPAAQTYIYPDLGIAFIAKPSSGEVLEQHLFSSMKVEDYVKKYGEDIPSYP